MTACPLRHSHRLLTAGSNSSNLPFWMLHAGLELRLLAAPHANNLLPSVSLWRQLRVASCKLCSAGAQHPFLLCTVRPRTSKRDFDGQTPLACSLAGCWVMGQLARAVAQTWSCSSLP